MVQIFSLLGDMCWSIFEGLDINSPVYAPCFMLLIGWVFHMFKKTISVRSYV